MPASGLIGPRSLPFAWLASHIRAMTLQRHASFVMSLVALAAAITFVPLPVETLEAQELPANSPEFRPAAPLAVTVTPLGTAAKGRPLPVGATPSFRIVVRNTGTAVFAGIVLTARIDDIKADNPAVWRPEGGALVTEIPRLGAGEAIERVLKVRVEKAPSSIKTDRVLVEARTADGATAAGETELRIADCVGAYRAKLAPLRTEAAPAIRLAAEETYKPDRTLPNARLFSSTGARTGNLANAEKLAATLAANGGADPEMGREWFRFLIQRFVSELSNYAGQDANPGLCANNYYQVAGYREGMLPITRRLEAVQTAANQTIEAARAVLKAGANEDLGALARRAVLAAGLDVHEGNISTLAVLAAARSSLKNRTVDGEQEQALSLVETAAWLAESEGRGRALARSFEAAYATIATAHKESCVCAF